MNNTAAYGIKVQDKSAERARVRVVNGTLKNVAQNKSYRGLWTPIWLHPYRLQRVKQFGGIDSVDCVVEDAHDHPVISVSDRFSETTLFDVTGTLNVKNPHDANAHLGEGRRGVTLVVQDANR